MESRLIKINLIAIYDMNDESYALFVQEYLSSISLVNKILTVNYAVSIFPGSFFFFF